MASGLRFSAQAEKQLRWREGGEGALCEPCTSPKASRCPEKAAAGGSWCGGDWWLWQLPGMAVMLNVGAVLSSSTALHPVPGQTLPLHSGYYHFHTYAEAAAFFAGITVLLSISGSRGPLLPGDFCTLCSVT